MAESKAAKAARLVRIEKQIAEAEVTLAALREKRAKLIGEATAPDVELDISPLWNAAPEMARKRTSKHACRVAWKRIPKAERPTMENAVSALKAWSRDPEWKKDGGQFIPNLARWIKERRWEEAPTQTEAPSRYRNAPVVVPVTAPEEAASQEDIAAAFAALKPRRMNS